MDQHPPPPAPLGCDATGTAVNMSDIQAPSNWKACKRVDPAVLRSVRWARRPTAMVWVTCSWPDRCNCPLGQVDGTQVILGKVLPVGPSRHSGRPGPASRMRRRPAWYRHPHRRNVAHGFLHRHTGVGLALLHQFQRSQVVHGALPGNTSTAVINWESVCRTTMAAFVIRRTVYCCSCGRGASPGHAPTSSGSRLTPSLRFTPSSVRSTSPVRGRGQALEQQLPQQFRRRHYLLPLSAVLPQFLRLRLPRRTPATGRRQILSRTAAPPAPRLSLQSMAAWRPFTLDPKYRSYPRALAHSLTVDFSTAASSPDAA